MSEISSELKKCAYEILRIANVISDSRVTEINDLVGLQEKALDYISKCCEETNLTHRLTLTDFAKALDCPIGSVKTTLRRLQDKGFVRRAAFKNGRGGWVKFEVIKRQTQ